MLKLLNDRVRDQDWNAQGEEVDEESTDNHEVNMGSKLNSCSSPMALTLSRFSLAWLSMLYEGEVGSEQVDMAANGGLESS